MSIAAATEEIATRNLEPPSTAGPGRLLLRRFRHQRLAMVGLGFLAFIALVAVFAPLVAPHDPSTQGELILAGSSGDHLLGTDDLGRDVLSRLIFGARNSLMVSVGIVTVATLAALPLALIAGYRGGRTDDVIMRVMDGFFAFPPLVLALVIRSVLGPSVRNLILAIAVVFIPSSVRLIRGQVLSIRQETYIEAAMSVGVPERQIVRRHVLPNVASPMIIQIALSLGFALLVDAGLSFLGLGAPPPAPSWGGMLKDAYDFVLSSPWQVFFPGLAITITVLAFNMVGDGLRDALGRTHSTFGIRRLAVRRPADEPAAPGSVLAVRDLAVEFATPSGPVRVVDGVGFQVAAGRTLGLVGESGCGKTVSALAVMGLLPARVGRVVEGSVRLDGRELLDLSPAEFRSIRGRDIAMVFQDPATSLNPAFTVGNQISEAVRTHRGLSRRPALVEAVEMLDLVGIPSPGRVARSYPHELSGGMRQRAMIAMALVGRPRVLIADEPTTALDVTIQAQILELIADLQAELDMAVVFVTHDLGVIAEVCDDVAVLYAGEVVEVATVADLFSRPRHPYTEALVASLPQATAPRTRLVAIPGQVPHPGQWPSGCHFHPRCAYAQERCEAAPVPLVDGVVRCIRTSELHLAGAGAGE